MVPSFIATPLSSFRAQYGIDADTKVSYCDGTSVIECVANAQAADVARIKTGSVYRGGSCSWFRWAARHHACRGPHVCPQHVRGAKRNQGGSVLTGLLYRTLPGCRLRGHALE